jgi:hypothetical protein
MNKDIIFGWGSPPFTNNIGMKYVKVGKYQISKVYWNGMHIASIVDRKAEG